ncbi:MAG TPA: amidohydrolase family protein [Gemmatimonadaceae bacterium]|nr:amidohydrolase family protein [Gemmatimonadaceae bacterium]
MTPSRDPSLRRTLGGRPCVALALALVACARNSQVQSASQSSERESPRYVAGPACAFVNGNWLADGAFTQRTFYSVNGVLRSSAPAHFDSTIDLSGGFVIPPFGDAHTHNLDGARNIDQVINAYMREGTFYVQVLTNYRSGADQVRGRFNRPCTLDVLYANGGITGTRSHPFLAYEPRALGIYQFDQWRARAADIWKSRIGEGDVYWFVDSQSDLEVKWPKILAGGPDLLKIFLLDASETSVPPPADATLQSGHGLKPSVVPAIVRRAHAAGLRVAAHVETARDFEVAADAGVDLFAHVPGYEMDPDAAPGSVLISDAVARKAGARGVVVIPTASLTSLVTGRADSAQVAARRVDLVRQNLRTLLRHGVRIAVGSDWYGQTAAREFAALKRLGLWDSRQLLDLWTETTPQSMFPRRRIGRLTDGYEASFLVLRANPLNDSTALSTITTRVKQGCIVHQGI